MEKVVLGLSGGVDSTVCGTLLKRMGYDVHALYLDIGRPGELEAARNAAEAIGVPFESLDIRRELDEHVIAPFCGAYIRGETPNPCILCNPSVKFRALCAHADALDAQFIATGHYARILREGGQVRLLRSKFTNDQSYMLHGLAPSQLRRLLLPLGEYGKDGVRELARELRLAVANKPDSMEICFIPDNNYAGFIERRGIVPPPGNFTDTDGNVLGQHMGIHHYTIGQRRGLRIALGERMFVSDIRPDTNEVVLSRGNGLFVTEFQAENANWLVEKPEAPFSCAVRVRHSRTETPALVVPNGDNVTVRTQVPVRAPTPGQSAVFYNGEVVLGGGVIRRNIP